jgi:hypothetical protein
MSAYWGSSPISLEHFSVDGEEIIGAEALGADST